MRKFTGRRTGPGVFCKAILQDTSAETTLIGFGKDAAALEKQLVKGFTYEISGCTLHDAEEDYMWPEAHRLDLHVAPTTVISKMDHIPQRSPNAPTLIGDLSACFLATIHAVVLTVKSITATATTPSAKPRQELCVTDPSGKHVRANLWGEFASCNIATGDIVRLEDARVTYFRNQLVVQATAFTHITVNSSTPEAIALRDWWNSASNEGHSSQPLPLSDPISIADFSQQPADSFNVVRGVVQRVGTQTPAYQACPVATCYSAGLTGTPRACRKCGGANFTWRYCLHFRLADKSAEINCTAFGEVGEKLVKMSADALMQLRETNLEAAGEKLTTSVVNRQFVLHMRLRKKETDVSTTFKLFYSQLY